MSLIYKLATIQNNNVQFQYATYISSILKSCEVHKIGVKLKSIYFLFY